MVMNLTSAMWKYLLPESLLDTNVFFLNRDSIFPALQSLKTIATYVFTFTVIVMVGRRQGQTGG